MDIEKEIEPKFVSSYIPMLHFNTINFEKLKSQDAAICTLQASSCFIIAVLHKGNIENNHYKIKGAYLAHINMRQITQQFDITASIKEFKEEMKDSNSNNYHIIVIGGTREDNISESRIMNNLYQLNMPVTNFRSVYSFSAKKLVKVLDINNIDLSSENILSNGYMKQVSLGITSSGIKIFTEKQKISNNLNPENLDENLDENLEMTSIINSGKYTEAMLHKNNEFSIKNIVRTRQHNKQPVSKVPSNFFIDTFNKEKKLEYQFRNTEEEANMFLKGTENCPVTRYKM